MQAPNKKREMDDNTKEMGVLFWKLHAEYIPSIYALPNFGPTALVDLKNL